MRISIRINLRKFYIQSPCISLLIVFFLSHTVFAQETLLGLTYAGGPTAGGTIFSLNTTGANFKVYRNFVNAGVWPQGDLVMGRDGYFYGMTTGHTIFKISSAGKMSFVKHLNDNSPGNYPSGNLIQAYDGNFYGMTSEGGNGYGSVFKMTPRGAITVLKTFDSTSGTKPRGSLIQAKDSNFYGMTYSGGIKNNGTIFKITPAGVLTVLKNLDATTTGGYPYGNLVERIDGNFYGMTSEGGTFNFGTIFKMTPAGTITVLKNLDTSNTGGQPYGSLIQAKDSNFYGMTYQGGANGYGTYDGQFGYGTIFKITPTGTLTVLKNLDAITGSHPLGNLVQGTDGNFYGMTFRGGTYNMGTIFKITPGGVLTVLRNLNNNTGYQPMGSLYKYGTGYFYGMTGQGGYGGGTIFKISTSGILTVLFRFSDGGLGQNPSGSLIQAKDGNYYGGASGTIFKMCTSTTFTVLASGNSPNRNLIQAYDGNFYGMTSQGGYGGGSIFKMTPTGTITVLKDFDLPFGTYPYGSLIQAKDSNFYGMTSQGGAFDGTNGDGYGTLFKITPTGTMTVLKDLNNTTGTNPYGSLVQGTDGNFYGMTSSGGTNGCGTIFKYTTTGFFTLLRNLDQTTGRHPIGSLIQATDGNFYGMTQYGGTYDKGTIFKITPTGTLTVLKSLNGTTTGGNPQGDLVQGSGGILYGMTANGGTYNAGTIFKITTIGTFTVLRQLNPDTDGGFPHGSLIIQKPNPIANPQSVNTPQNTPIKIKLTGSGGAPLTYTVSTQPLHGTAIIVKDTLTYTPTASYGGYDSLYFTSTWGCQKSAPAKIKIAVTLFTLMVMESDASTPSVDKQSLSGDGKLTVSIQPNPSSNYFTITTQSSNLQPVSIRVVDDIGRTIEVMNNASANSAIRVGERYQNGLYFAEVIQGKERVRLKLMKGSQ